MLLSFECQRGIIMPRIFLAIYLLVAVVLAGMAVTALLSMNMFDGAQLLYASLGAALVALPISRVDAKKVTAV